MSWLEKTEVLIKNFGGAHIVSSKGSDGDKTAYLIQFDYQGDTYRVFWPVLPYQREEHELAANRQAATMLYHDVKDRLLRVKVFGVRQSFFEHMLLPSGKTVGSLSNSDLQDQIPKINGSRHLLESGK